MSVSKLTVILEGDEHEIDCDEGETVLEACQREGLDAPYSCLAGVCITCRAQVHVGEVEMDEAEALDEEQIDSGLILTCQAHPKTENVKLEFLED